MLMSIDPAQLLLSVINRLYSAGLTNLSGGNLSIREPDGAIWVTPRGIDKGSLTPDDMVRVLPDGTPQGRHAPSSELPFHRAIYARRPDLRAVVHAHAPALIAYSIARKLPNTRLMPRVFDVCGDPGRAPYALPGSPLLGENIAAAFETGANAVILDNHGVVTAGESILEAYQRLETLHTYARSEMAAHTLGELRPAPEHAFGFPEPEMPTSFAYDAEPRNQLAKLAQRAVERGLFGSVIGEMSIRFGERRFLITPPDRGLDPLQPDDLVPIRAGLHAAIYQRHPHINAIAIASPPYLGAYALVNRALETRTIPESYVLLLDAPTLPYTSTFAQIAEIVGRRAPVVILPHVGAVVTGANPLNVLDRLEVAEITARSLIETAPLGKLIPITGDDLIDLERAFASWIQN